MKMNKIYSLMMLAVALLAGLASCGKDEPFPNPDDFGSGYLSTSKLMLNIDGSETNKEAPATRAVDVAAFTVDICKVEGSKVKSFLYADMPSVVELPVGEYVATAHLGEPAKASFDAPYYEGRSEKFSIKADEITDVQTIECSLANVKVSIYYTPELKKVMDDDAYVNVHLANDAMLNFAKEEARSGYFAYIEGNSTLVATFHGKVNGVEETTSKVYTEVQPGVHYRIKYAIHNPGADPNASGKIIPGLTVDASVDIVELNYNITWEDDTIPDDPNNPSEPDDPKYDGPSLTMDAPLSFDKLNEVTPSSKVVVNVASETGITAFTVDIDSSTLTPAELEGVGLASHLDLVNPGNLEEGIAGLGLPVNVGGKKEVTFDISSFMPLLAVLGNNNHNFVLTVSDASGTVKKTLKLHMNP